jgi:outer membrane protein OmpA-like peptidoglycan-associated protein
VRDSTGLNKLLFGLDGWALRRLASDANAAAGLPMGTAPAFPTETAPFLARLLDGGRIYLLGVLPGQEIPAHLVRSPAKPAPKKEVVEQIVEQVEAAPPPKKEEKKVRTPIHIIEVPDVLFALGSAVPALDEEGWLVGAIATAVLYAKDEGAARQERLIVCGHADTTGEPLRNYEIAEQRAQMVKAILEQNAEGWKTLANKHCRTRDYQRTLKSLANAYGWSCDPGEVDNRNGPKTEAAVKAFQAECNERYGMDLKADGIVGPKTWTAIHRALCALVCEHLDITGTATPTPPKWLRPIYGYPDGKGVYSCGESFPVAAVGRDGVESQENRRVELVFAPKNLEVKAAVNKNVNMKPEECVLYDGERVAMLGIALMKTQNRTWYFSF